MLSEIYNNFCKVANGLQDTTRLIFLTLVVLEIGHEYFEVDDYFHVCVCKKTFAGGSETAKFMNVFSLKVFH